MATTLSDIIFIGCAVAIAISQWLILRSTARGMKYSDARADSGGPTDAVTDATTGTVTGGATTGATRPDRAALEWAYALVPALALVALLVFSWRSMHPSVIRAQGTAPSSIGVGS